jgi:hypothetical protein
MRINAKPLDFIEVIDFDTKNIKQVYKGRLDNCRCGCAGDYFKLGENDTEIDRALGQLIKYAERGEVMFSRFTYKNAEDNELYLEFETHIEESYDSDLDGDDDDDYYYRNNEEMSMGYGFYIKDIEK